MSDDPQNEIRYLMPPAMEGVDEAMELMRRAEDMIRHATGVDDAMMGIDMGKREQTAYQKYRMKADGKAKLERQIVVDNKTDD